METGAKTHLVCLGLMEHETKAIPGPLLCYLLPVCKLWLHDPC